MSPDVREVTVPDIGEFTDVPVIEILVGVGDEVAVDTPLLTLESDKATMDVPSPFAGKVEEILVELNDKVSEGTPLMRLSAAEGGAEEAETGAAEVDAPAGRPSSVHGSAPSAGPRVDAAEPPAEPSTTTAPQSKPPSSGAVSEDGGEPIYASPSVRKLAREREVDLRGANGTGRKGRITKDDVERLARRQAAPEVAPGVGLEIAPWPQVDFAKYGEIDRVPLSRIKKISGPNLTRNWVMIPHVTHHDEADITDLEAFRKQINSEQDEVKVTMVALLVKACVSALKKFPEFNSSLAGDELVLKRYYHIGFAADTPQGLLVPVIRDADRKGLIEIARDLTELSGKAREGKISAEEMRGGTFSISSLGGIGGTGFTPIVNAPEVAILGVTRATMRPTWNGEEFVPRLIVPLSLSYDHRVVDGAAAARFTAYLATELADFRRVLL